MDPEVWHAYYRKAGEKKDEGKGLELLTAGASDAEGRAVLEQAMLARTDFRVRWTKTVAVCNLFLVRPIRNKTSGRG